MDLEGVGRRVGRCAINVAEDDGREGIGEETNCFHEESQEDSW